MMLPPETYTIAVCVPRSIWGWSGVQLGSDSTDGEHEGSLGDLEAIEPLVHGGWT